ncbi:hypothetical protein AOXY_G20000 [Acipenser oxyrinchus oxyrinchus]|uniref:Uncharacterized protein n=1 Tax=Acipenser oxyrinchus oxyrinchus TaxID=40147 RepID=A0AAD8G0Z9_ACIOX|nr:hypothetical protein AOXY_G20000 [Acipenser oxyrinchus oxyrinchus]
MDNLKIRTTRCSQHPRIPPEVSHEASVLLECHQEGLAGHDGPSSKLTAPLKKCRAVQCSALMHHHTIAHPPSQ